MAKAKADNVLTVNLEPAPMPKGATTLMQRAQAIQIVDKVTHEQFRGLLKEGKVFLRDAREYFLKAKRPLNDARAVLLQMERDACEPLEAFVQWAEQRDAGYVAEQRRLEQAETDRRRREAEEQERQRRALEAAEAEERALALESASDDLSAREQAFVRLFVATGRTANDAAACASKAGYKDARAAVAKLLDSKKVNAAIAAADTAAAIRREAESKQAAPLAVEVAPVESQIGHVAGTSLRTYYSCGPVDLAALVLAVAEDVKAGDTSRLLALQPNLPYLNGQARDLKEMFGKVWPMCQLEKRTGVTG